MTQLAEPTTVDRGRSLAYLFLISVAALLLELMLIRWIATEFRVFAYLQNSVLVACLMGFGMGCFSAEKAWGISRALPPLLVLALMLSVPAIRSYFAYVTLRFGAIGDFDTWAGTSKLEFDSLKSFLVALVVAAHVAIILFLAWITFIPFGQAIGRCLDSGHNTIVAYSVNILGSFCGIALFTSLSAWRLGPLAWNATLLALLLAAVLLSGARWPALAGLGALSAIVGFGQYALPDGLTVWTPYQKIHAMPYVLRDNISRKTHEYIGIQVNNTGYQTIINLKPKSIAEKPSLFTPEIAGLSQYDLPMLFYPRAKHVLILGAGSGNDAAGALRNGAGSVTAVEIDPVIIWLGKSFHFERPYEDPRVRIVNDDARAFFAASDESFDLIVFSLLDSHTTGPMTNSRLDHYVYTMESLRLAKNLLTPHGVMILSFEAYKPYLADRLNTTMTELFGAAPLVFRVPNSPYGPGGIFFVSGSRQTIELALSTNRRLQSHIANLQERYPRRFDGVAQPITDDWPYLYLDEPRIPALFAVITVILVGIFLYCGRLTGVIQHLRGWHWRECHFFFLGAAFMLLEISMISKSAIAFGSTWVVNAIIISGIFAMILIANLIYAVFRCIPMTPVYVLLICACAVILGFDFGDIANLPYGARVAVVGLMATLPMLFSGIVFIHSLNATRDKARALGANLLGALLGGLLLPVSFLTGMKFLILLVGVFYLLAVGFASLSRLHRPTIA
jgi:spermidine synthase